MLQHRLAERREPDHHARRQAPGSSGKLPPPEARAAAQRRGDVPHRGEMPHLLDRDLEDGAAPARHGLRFRARQSFLRPLRRLNAA